MYISYSQLYAARKTYKT